VYEKRPKEETTVNPAEGIPALGGRPRLAPGNPQLAVEAAGLVKRFGSARALDGVDLTVPAGTVYGLLGPNGAGKSTTVRVLATLLAPDAGTARVLGRDVVKEPAAVRRLIALAGQSATVDEDLTGPENLVFLGRLAGLGRRAARTRAAELLAAFGLEQAAGRPVKTFSGGMRRRLDLAASLIVSADLYFLDEPTTGLDPASRADVHQIIRSIAAAGATVLLTTQHLEEADQLASRIAIIDRGSLVTEGTPGELKAAAGAGTLRIRLTDPAHRPQAVQVLTPLLGAPAQAAADPVMLTATIAPAGGGQAASEQAAAALGELARAGITVGEFTLGQPSLDEVFLALTTASSHSTTTTETIS
jgi:ABC-2 type transport system ATP-binding protein